MNTDMPIEEPFNPVISEEETIRQIGADQTRVYRERVAGLENIIKGLMEEKRQIQNALSAAEGDDLVSVILGMGVRIGKLEAIKEEAARAVNVWQKVYEFELAETQLRIDQTKKARDGYGVNFFQGKWSGLVALDIGLSKLKRMTEE